MLISTCDNSNNTYLEKKERNESIQAVKWALKQRTQNFWAFGVEGWFWAGIIRIEVATGVIIIWSILGGGGAPKCLLNK